MVKYEIIDGKLRQMREDEKPRKPKAKTVAPEPIEPVAVENDPKD